MNVAVSAAIRKSAASASENPPPAAAPCTLAITGAGSRCNPSVAAWKWSMSSPIAAAATLRSPPNSVMSPPATNAAPGPPQHHRPHIVARLQCSTDLPKRPRHRQVDRVQPFGPVEGDEGDALVDVQQDGVGHGGYMIAPKVARCE